MNLQDYVQGYEQSLDSFTEILEPLLNTPIEEITAKLDVIERARVQLLVAYSINNLISCKKYKVTAQPYERSEYRHTTIFNVITVFLILTVIDHLLPV